jgi:protein-disulfide isomerase
LNNRGVDLSVPVTEIDHARGAIHAPVTIVEYGDFECSVCRAVEPGVRMILEQHSSKVRFVYRHFPIESAHPHALIAAEAAETAASQGKFWEMHDLLMQQGARLDRETLDRNAESLGLDIAEFKASLDDEIYRQRIREQVDGAIRDHVRSTPAFFVNGRFCDTSAGIHALADRVRSLV